MLFKYKYDYEFHLGEFKNHVSGRQEHKKRNYTYTKYRECIRVSKGKKEDLILDQCHNFFKNLKVTFFSDYLQYL